MSLPPGSLVQYCYQAVAGTLSPHHKTTRYFGGLLIKIEHFGDLCNWTLVQRNSLDSNCRDANCYRIGAVAERGLQGLRIMG